MNSLTLGHATPDTYAISSVHSDSVLEAVLLLIGRETYGVAYRGARSSCASSSGGFNGVKRGSPSVATSTTLSPSPLMVDMGEFMRRRDGFPRAASTGRRMGRQPAPDPKRGLNLARLKRFRTLNRIIRNNYDDLQWKTAQLSP